MCDFLYEKINSFSFEMLKNKSRLLVNQHEDYTDSTFYVYLAKKRNGIHFLSWYKHESFSQGRIVTLYRTDKIGDMQSLRPGLAIMFHVCWYFSKQGHQKTFRKQHMPTALICCSTSSRGDRQTAVIWSRAIVRERPFELDPAVHEWERVARFSSFCYNCSISHHGCLPIPSYNHVKHALNLTISRPIWLNFSSCVRNKVTINLSQYFCEGNF